MNRKTLVLQNGSKDCASACLLSIIRHYGGNVSKEELSYIIKTNEYGTNAYNMILGMKTLGFEGVGYKYNIDELIKFNDLPLVCHTLTNGYYHFIVLYKIKNEFLIIMDPSSGFKKISKNEFKNIYLNACIKFYPIKKIPLINNKKSLFKYFIEIIIYERKHAYSIFVLSIITIILTIIFSSFFKIITDNLIINFSINTLIILSIVFIFIMILKNIFTYYKNKRIIDVKHRIDINITNRIVRHILFLPYEYIKNKPIGDIVSRINDLNSFKDIITLMFSSFFVDIFIIIISMIVLIFININLFKLSLLSILIYAIFVFLYSVFYKKDIVSIHEKSSIYNKNLYELIEGYESFRNINMMNKLIENNTLDYNSLVYNEKKFESNMNSQNYIKDIIFDLFFIITLSLGAYYIKTELITLGDLLFFSSILVLFIEPIKSILDIEPNITLAINSFKRINDILMIKREYVSDTKVFLEGDIEIKNLFFSYDNVKEILNSVNMYIPYKSKVFIYGESGSGKSTLFKILLKYLKDYKGDIKIHNYNLLDINNDLVSYSFTYVSQKEILINDTLKNNIMLFRDIDSSYYERVLSLTKVDIIRDKKALRDSFLIEDNGFNLSGGERQKIILARALLKQSNYIILDESLSEVPKDEEIEIIKNILGYFKDKTVIYVSHKEEVSYLFEKRFEIRKEEK